MHINSEGEGKLTNVEAVELHKKCVRLTKCIKLFRKMQQIYILGACVHIAEENARVREPVDVEDEKLWLPSDFDAEVHSSSC